MIDDPRIELTDLPSQEARDVILAGLIDFNRSLLGDPQGRPLALLLYGADGDNGAHLSFVFGDHHRHELARHEQEVRIGELRPDGQRAGPLERQSAAATGVALASNHSVPASASASESGWGRTSAAAPK